MDYHTLLGLYRDDDGRFFWEILYGDFTRRYVEDEFDAYRKRSSKDIHSHGTRCAAAIDDGESVYRLRIIETDGEQASIDAKVAELDEENFYLNRLNSH